MAEFSKAVEVEPESYAGTVVGALRAAGRVEWKRGNRYFLAKQHGYFLSAYDDCKCEQHSCTGCALTLKVATMVEKDISSLDPIACDREEAKAAAYWAKEWHQRRVRLDDITERSHALKRQREGKPAVTRERSIALAKQAADE